MSITHHMIDNICFIEMIGDLTLDGLNVKTYIDPILDDESIRGLGMDLTQVNLIDSSGIGMIVTILKSLAVNDAGFVLYGINRQVRKSLEVVGLLGRLTICDTKEETLSTLKRQSTNI